MLGCADAACSGSAYSSVSRGKRGGGVGQSSIALRAIGDL